MFENSKRIKIEANMNVVDELQQAMERMPKNKQTNNDSWITSSIPAFDEGGIFVGNVRNIEYDHSIGDYYAILAECVPGTDYENTILAPRIIESNFKIGNQLAIMNFVLKHEYVEEPVEEGDGFAKTVSKIKPLKITKRVLVEKTGSQRVIIANGNNGLIDEMREAAKKVGGYNSPKTYYAPTFSICCVEDFKDPSKYIARDLTDYRYTNHGTIEFNNVGARSYMRVTVDMNDEDLIGKCAVFDNKDREPVVVEFDRFITCKDTYGFRFNKTDEHMGQILPGIKRFIWGKLKYYSNGIYHENLGMLGVDPIRSDRIKFIAASGQDYDRETFAVQDILRMPEFEFECHDCVCCELVPYNMQYLKEE